MSTQQSPKPMVSFSLARGGKPLSMIGSSVRTTVGHAFSTSSKRTIPGL
nr:hypothetical protein [Sinomonas atrocyanea]